MYPCLLFVPATEKMLLKSKGLSPDSFIFDLEDSIPQQQKEEALQLLKAFIEENLSAKRNKWFVRLNSGNIEKEAEALDCPAIDGFMIPKFESSSQTAFLDRMKTKKKIIALIETCKGVEEIQAISCANTIEAIAFGAEDYCAQRNMEAKKEYLIPIKSMLLNSCIANNKLAFDTPSFQIRNEEAFREDVAESVSLGFHGKLAIHPNQIAVIQKEFGFHDVEYMKTVIRLFEQQGGGVMEYDGKVYENPHINRLKKILHEHNTTN